MTTEHPSQAARYVTLRDYLRVLRRYRIMIVLITVLGAVAGYVAAARENPVYEATSQVAFQDPTQNLSLVGFGSGTSQSPAQLAEVNAEVATHSALIAGVKKKIRSDRPVSDLSSSVSTLVSPTSGLLGITAKGPTGPEAAALANGVANALVGSDNQQTRQQFNGVIKALKARIKSLGPTNTSGGKPNPSAGQLSFYEDELARLQTLGAFAKSAQVVKTASAPGSPISPKKVRSTIIGLVVGLLLALIAAFVRDSLDRRIRNPHDMESTFDLPVLGHVRNQSLGRVAYMGNGSGDDHKLDLESFRIMRRNLEFLDPDRKPLRSILVTSALPQEGKTTVASSLAFAMASAGKRVLLVDCDLRRPALATRLGVEQSPGISEYLADLATPQELLRTVEFHEPALVASSTSNGAGTKPIDHSLVCIPSGAPTSRAAELLGSDRFREFLEQVSSAYETVVLDSSPLLPVADTLEMLPLVDAIVMCAREEQTTRQQADAAMAALGRFPQRPTGLVITGVKPRGDEYEVYTYSYGYG
jgi:polysaccharide biosynthesis transport protein